MGYLLGIDIGSSSIKTALVDAATGRCIATAQHPDLEAPIKAARQGWAEQAPDTWWDCFKAALRKMMQQTTANPHDVDAIGITYQMHGLVCVDRDGMPLRDAIIWCDSRGVPYGEAAYKAIGETICQQRLLGSPGNFTASKLAWVRDNEPSLFAKIKYTMLPGDYIALRLSGQAATTMSGLSEMTLWDYSQQQPASFLMDYWGIPHSYLPPLVDTFGVQAEVSASAASELGLRCGTPIAYRAGDQPNNALSLCVHRPGEIAATAGTSGVVYGVSDRVACDPLSRINTFLHVNHSAAQPRLGLMHCFNGCGIQNAWMRRIAAPQTSYDDINQLAATVPAGSDGISIIPFGNGAERVLANSDVQASIHGISFNSHSTAHLLRAAQEGIAFAFKLGIDLMQQLGMQVKTIHAGHANMFLSPIFRQTLAAVSGATIGLYDTDGSIGAARAAGIGIGLYSSIDEAFAALSLLHEEHPSESLIAPCNEAYQRWLLHLNKDLHI